MAGVNYTRQPKQSDYPTSDGKPMAETDWHRDLMNTLIQTLAVHYCAAEPMVYVSGNTSLSSISRATVVTSVP